MKKNKILAVFTVGMLLLMSGCLGRTADQGHTVQKAEYSQGMTERGNAADKMDISGLALQRYEDFFAEAEIHSVYIEMDARDWRCIQEAPWEKKYYEADVDIDGITIENVGIRTRGNSSLRAAERHHSDRFPFRIKFDKYADSQTFLGLDELVLNNSNDDPSFLREYLGYEAFRQLGVEAPYVFFSNVYINGELYGLYVGVEAVDNSYLDRVYDGHHGNLYKAEVGATLETGMRLDLLEQKKGDEEGKHDLQQLIGILEETEKGEKGDIDDILDIDSVLQYFAVNAVIHNWDDYAGQFAHNYYLYRDDDRFHVIAWDMNEGFLQTQAFYQESDGARQDISTPITGNTQLKRRPLVEKILSVPEYYQSYLDYCGILSRWLKDVSQNQLIQLMILIQDSAERDPTKLYSMDAFREQFDEDYRNGLAGFLKERAAYLAAALNDLSGTSFQER